MNKVPQNATLQRNCVYTVLSTLYLYPEFVVRVLIFFTIFIDSLLYYRESVVAGGILYTVLFTLFFLFGWVLIFLSFLWRNNAVLTQLAYVWSIVFLFYSHPISVLLLAHAGIICLFYIYHIIDSNKKFQQFRFVDAIEFLERRIPVQDPQQAINAFVQQPIRRPEYFYGQQYGYGQPNIQYPEYFSMTQPGDHRVAVDATAQPTQSTQPLQATQSARRTSRVGRHTRQGV